MITSLGISISMIQSSVEDWDKYPITTDVERTDGSHTTDELYPAITICRGTETQPNNWALSELILDFLAMWKQDFGSGEPGQIHKDFFDIKDARFKHLNDTLENVYRKHELFPYADPYANPPAFKYGAYSNILTLVKKKFATISDFDSFLKNNMFIESDFSEAFMPFMTELMNENYPDPDGKYLVYD